MEADEVISNLNPDLTRYRRSYKRQDKKAFCPDEDACREQAIQVDFTKVAAKSGAIAHFSYDAVPREDTLYLSMIDDDDHFVLKCFMGDNGTWG